MALAPPRSGFGELLQPACSTCAARRRCGVERLAEASGHHHHYQDTDNEPDRHDDDRTDNFDPVYDEGRDHNDDGCARTNDSRARSTHVRAQAECSSACTAAHPSHRRPAPDNDRSRLCESESRNVGCARRVSIAPICDPTVFARPVGL